MKQAIESRVHLTSPSLSTYKIIQGPVQSAKKETYVHN